MHACRSTLEDPTITLSGSGSALERVARIAAALGLSATPLAAPHPFHNPLLHSARQELATRLAGYRLREFTIPVFSPILGRFYRSTDELGAALAAQLVLPVEFGPAVDRLHRAGARVWVELGAGGALTSLVRARYPEVRVLTPLRRKSVSIAADAAYLSADLGAEQQHSLSREHVPTEVAAPPEPAPRPAGISRADITTSVRELYAGTLEYPLEVFEDSAELEADLGIDSVKQTELMRRVGDLFELGPPPQGLRMGEYRTFGSVVDFVGDSLARR